MSVNLEYAFELRKQGKTLREISTACECSEGWIKKKLAGVPKGEASVNFEAVLALKKISRDLAEVVRKMQ